MSEAQQIAAPGTRPSPIGAIAICALALFTIWISWRAKTLESQSTPEHRPLALLHKHAPEFTLPKLDGGTISLASYRPQKKVVVSFWASWCGPCRMELPVLKSFYEKAHKPGSDFEFLAINLDDDRDAAAKAATEMKLPFPVLLDPRQKAAGDYGVWGIPVLYVVDQRGRVSFGEAGFNMAIEGMLAQELGVDPKLIFQAGGPHASARY